MSDAFGGVSLCTSQLVSCRHSSSAWKEDEPYCEPVWDSVLCWPAVPAGETAWRSCWYVLQYIPSLDVKSVVLPPGAKAYRICDKDGKWLWGNWTNYSECLNFTTTKDLDGMYPLCTIVGRSDQEMVLPQEDRVPGGQVALLREKTATFGIWLWHIVLRLRLKFELQLAPVWHNDLLEIGYFKDSSEAVAL
ncbi:calcitonin receptor [Trichonephila clavipes]|nr:calcitonin receptor [Trichonephila clavipes]